MNNTYSSNSSASLTIQYPNIKWAENETSVYVSFAVPDCKNINLISKDTHLLFEGQSANSGSLYACNLSLYDAILPEISVKSGSGQVQAVLTKFTPGRWNRLVQNYKEMRHKISVDWLKWVDEENSNDADDSSELVANSNMFGLDNLQKYAANLAPDLPGNLVKNDEIVEPFTDSDEEQEEKIEDFPVNLVENNKIVEPFTNHDKKQEEKGERQERIMREEEKEEKMK